MRRLCLECTNYASPRSKNGSRCPRCETKRNNKRNADPKRAAYKDPVYRSFIVGPHCSECGTTEDLTKDHIWPLAKGGSNTVNNIRTLCRSCNSSKGQR
jgi:5-methylcytosine-specific restriction endonuclease McrA